MTLKNKYIVHLVIYLMGYVLFMFIINGCMIINNEYEIFINGEDTISVTTEEELIKKYHNDKVFNSEIEAIDQQLEFKKNELKVTDVDSDEYKKLANTIDYIERNKYRTALVKTESIKSRHHVGLQVFFLDLCAISLMALFVYLTETSKNKYSEILIIILLTSLIVYNIVIHGIVNANTLEFVIMNLCVPAFIMLYSYEYGFIFKIAKKADEKNEK